jgi:F-box and WD-40 domain protein 1/11
VTDAHDGSVIALAVDESEGGAKMITGSSDGTAGVWDITWGLAAEEEGDVRNGGPETEEEGNVRNGSVAPRWKAEVVRRETLRGHTAAVLDVALAKDFIITCSKDTTIRIYNRYDYTLVRAIVGLHTAPVNCLALHPDPNVPEFISASGDGRWIRGPIQFPTFYTRHSRISAQEGGQALACVAWRGPLVVTGAKDGQLGVYDAKGEFLADYTRHSDSVRAVDLEVDETGAGTIVSASYDHTVVMWDADSGLERYVFNAHSGIVLDVQLTNGRLITYVKFPVVAQD